MKTKDKIIDTAVRLYNERGLSNVTSRHIGKEINISHGNLEYYFPNKEALLIAIYTQMRNKISKFYEDSDNDNPNPIIHLNRLLIQLEELQDNYMFFNIDLLEISRKYEKIHQLLEHTLLTRKVQIARFFQKCIEQKFMLQEPEDGYYERLQHTIRILITFWKSQEIVLAYFNLNRNGEMAKHIWDLLLPHFSIEGKLAYQSVIENFSVINSNSSK